MKKMCRICLLITTFLLLVSFSVPAMAVNTVAVGPHVTNGCLTLDAKEALSGTEQLLDTAKAAILYELENETMVYAWNPDAQVDPSGMNKLMTALLALELADPQEIVTVTRSALDSVAIGSVSAGLKRWEEISLHDLLYCMMVGSANDAAAVIAEHIGSTQEQFVQMMNDRAAELGCTNTCFMNPTGLPVQGQYTSARDLARITAAALENELFVEMFCAVNYTVPATNKAAERYVVTTNYLTSKETVKSQYDARVTGGKTGALSTTDRSLISTAEYGGKRYLAIVMSAQGTVTADGLSVKTFGSFEETRVLLDHGFNDFSVRQVLQSGQVLAQYDVENGENAVVCGPSQTLDVTLPKNISPEKVTYRCVLNQDQIKAPLQAGTVLGSAEVWYDGICVGRADLVAMEDVYVAGEHISALQPIAPPESDEVLQNWLLIGGLVVLGAGVVTALVLLILRLVRKHQLDRRHKLINGGRP